MPESALPASRSKGWPPCLQGIPSEIDTFLRNQLYQRELDGLSPGIEYQLDSGGKRFRPCLTVWFGQHLGADRSACVRFGSAVELLHNVFLIQDDIQDGDHFRRGRPTLWREIGVPRALNVADYLLAEAYHWVARSSLDPETQTSIAQAFTQTFQTTVIGQALDLEPSTEPLEWPDYLRVVRHKTGRYLALPWVGAALLGARDGADLWPVGDLLGPAFQISDDVLDLSTSKGRGGSVGGDIREGKPSALSALASERVSDDDRGRWRTILAAPRDQTSDPDVEWVCDLYQKLDVVREAMLRARQLADQACDLFASLPGVGVRTADEFRSIATFAVERGH